MDKKVIDEPTCFGRNLYISRAGGYALVTVSILEDEKKACIHDLIVHKSIRGTGLGDQLLNDACGEATKAGAEVAELTVQPLSWMEEWYERSGFMFTGFRNAYKQDVCAVMEKDLTRRESVEPQKS